MLLFIFVLFASLIGVVLYKAISYKNPKTINFKVKSKSSLTRIAQELQDDKVIPSALLFKFYARLLNKGTYIKSGDYILSEGVGLLDVFFILSEGKSQNLISVTIPEGYTLNQIAERLSEYGVVSRDEFIKYVSSPESIAKYNSYAKSAEGFLFPDTYKFAKDYPVSQVVDAMLKNFYKRFKEIYTMDISDEELYKKIIIASIVEREYAQKDEAAKIASVFYNRLKSSYRLESCATVVYIISDILKKGKPKRLFYEDLKLESPYNTYRNAGLPPAPISNPGLVSLNAAFFPEDTDYWFFVFNSEKGRHEFSKTFSEHLQSKLLYIKN